MKTQITSILVALAGVFASPASAANNAIWANWTAHTFNTVSGAISTPSGPVAVGYSGEINFVQINNVGTNYYIPNSPFISPTVPNAPPKSDIISLVGGASTGAHTLTFDPPVDNPIMAIVSLGQPSITVTYDFDVAFTILSYGPGYWGGPGTLNNVGGKRLTGVEGHGTIRFIGTVSEINWTIPNPETWHGFTVGLLGGTPCPCDLNGDGFVDDDDFVLFVSAYNILDCHDPAMPARCPADFNGDSVVDDEDFVVFIVAYNELVCP